MKIIYPLFLCILMVLGLVMFLDGFRDDEETNRKDFLNNLLYRYPESYEYDTTEGIICVLIADETVYCIHVKSENNEQHINTESSDIFRETVNQLQEHHINVSLSKNRGTYSVYWYEELFIPTLESEKSVIMKVL